MQRKRPAKHNHRSQGSRRRTVLPVVFALLSLLLMVLPLESPVLSVKAVLSYIFIPQIRAAHGAMQYADGVSQAVRELLDTHRENETLRDEMDRLRMENARAREAFAENERLSAALKLRAPKGWQGIWARTAYREPSQWNSVVIDKGSVDGISPRAAVVALREGNPVLAGVVLETDERTAKVLLLRDEDFSAAVYTAPSGEEGLLSGAGAGPLKIDYLPLLSDVQIGEKVYTSSTSSIFPSGILVGTVVEVEEADSARPWLRARVSPLADAGTIRELFILTRQPAGRH